MTIEEADPIAPVGTVGSKAESRIGVRRYSNPWFILTLLLISVVISFIDRQVIGVLVDPIRKSLDFTDFQIGLISGPAFFTLYLLGGIVGGWTVDRYSRTAIIAIGMTGWSFMTAFCGFASSFMLITLGRMGVGFSEGTLGPGVHSLIADSFDKKRLAMAMSIYSAAGALGSGISLFVGGLILDHFTNAGGFQIPILGFREPWQLTFIAVSLPGFLLAPAIYFCLKIRPRAQIADFKKDGLLGEFEGFWRDRWLLLILYTVGIGTVTGAKLSFVLWIPTLLIRVHKMTPATTGTTLGVMMVALGLLGSLIWGVIATYLAKRGRNDASMMTMVWAVGGFAIIVFLPPLMPNSSLVLLLLAPCLVFAQSFIGLGHAAIQQITPSPLRGRVSALFNGVATLLGVVVGPTGTGFLTTYLFKDDQKLGLSIAVMTGSMCLLGFLCLVLCVKPYRRALILLDQTYPEHRPE